MYTDYYNLREKPFNLTPSPRFLYLGEVHKEALALLTYGVVERKGFILLTGEVGTGKTTMVHALLNNLDKNVQTVHISNPGLSPKDFIKYLAYSVFKKNVRFKTKGEVLLEFESFLKDCLRLKKNFVLIIDEAQNLSFEVLEEIRLLSNMETGEDKLINIFLVGQPELKEKLNESRCRALLQRISIRYDMKPLELKETGEYIATRFKMAGAKEGNKIFTKSVIKAIYNRSEGYPRLINILADNVLLLGYSRRQKISASMVEECYEDLRIEAPEPRARPNEMDRGQDEGEAVIPLMNYWKWVAVFLVIATVGFVIISSIYLLRPQLQKIDLEIKTLKNEIKTFKSKMDEYKRPEKSVFNGEERVKGSGERSGVSGQ